ncbi:MAG: SpoIIE family protein phosphatase, partial [Bacteroidales bacterium]|nr:SpoIIE family protein phosphatase [Bacteroidales bacterium]
MVIKPKSSKGLAAVQGLLIVLVSVITLQATSLLQMYYSRKVLTEEANRRAESELETTELEITAVAQMVETAVNNVQWHIARLVDNTDSLVAITRRMVKYNDVIFGSAIALTQDHLSPYSYLKDGHIVSTDALASASYDYKNKEWYLKPQELKRGYWSEPYFDEGGGQMLMTTYSVPIADDDGTVVAVFTADISLQWLSALVEDIDVYPSALSMVVSGSGKIIVSPDAKLSMTESIQGLADKASPDDSAGFNQVNRAILAGETGNAKVKRNGEVNHIFYDAIESMGWSMSIIIPEKEIYGGINRLRNIVLALQLLGVLMIIIIITYTVVSQMKLREMSEKESLINGELKIARDIQMSMIPKVFPAFPERTDIDLYAALVPAREVGGDLYDFYIRDDKLFFCIGDVSGKGVPASLFMAVARNLFRSVSAQEDSPAKIVSSLNDTLTESNESAMFVTFFCGVLDMGSGLLRYCNAGHNAPALLTDKIGQLVVEPNIPLGVMPGFDFAMQEVAMHYDDALFLYTDGVTEAENANHVLFGEDRMLGVLHVRRSAEQQLIAVKDAVLKFRGDAPQSDDITALFIHYLGHPDKLPMECKIVFDNDVSQIPRLEGFMDQVQESAGLDPGTVASLNLALEEAVVNVMMYAYPKGETGRVNLKASIDDKSITFLLYDRGVPFDPTAAPEA